jgi:hypothetical protein
MARRSSSKKHRSKRYWSRDPNKCKSDWTLHLCRESSGKRDAFFLLTKVLHDMPPERAPYFEKIFKDNVTPIGRGESELTISDEAADNFGVLLDFLYCQTEEAEQEFLFNVKHGMALRKIAEYYEIRPLQEMLSTFYLETTLAFNVGESIDRAKKCETDGKHVSALSTLDQFVHGMHTVEYIDEEEVEPEFLLKALVRRKALKLSKNKSDSENISCLVALCTEQYKDKMNKSFFYKLTHAEHIPFIDQEAALQLLMVEAELDIWKDGDSFSSLQGRCIRSLLSDWAEVRNKFESEKLYWKTLRRLSPSILGILLMHSTGTAHGVDESADPEISELTTVLSN